MHIKWAAIHCTRGLKSMQCNSSTNFLVNINSTRLKCHTVWQPHWSRPNTFIKQRIEDIKCTWFFESNSHELDSNVFWLIATQIGHYYACAVCLRLHQRVWVWLHWCWVELIKDDYVNSWIFDWKFEYHKIYEEKTATTTTIKR